MAKKIDAPKTNGERLIVYVNVTNERGELLERYALTPMEHRNYRGVNWLAADVVDVLSSRFEAEEAS